MKKLVLFAAVVLLSVACKKAEIKPIEDPNELKSIQYNIGSWNMDEEVGISLDINVPENVVYVEVTITSDSGSLTNLSYDGGYMIDNGKLYVHRKHDGYFDQIAFDDDSMNRGVVSIQYK